MKNKYKIIIVLSFIVVFAAGLVSGIFCDKYFIKKDFRKSPPGRKPSGHFPTLEDMSKELDLEESQEHKIREVFKNTEKKLDEMRHQIGKKFSSIRKELIEDINSILNDEQKVKFDEMIQRYLQKYLEQRKRSDRRPKGPSKDPTTKEKK
jgi:Spy/CpxP family protein refolding chaperone